jgi:hypothetical protein
MIEKRVKKIFELTVLIGVRQIWGLLCNLYLLSYQPYLTLKTIRAKKDKSQFVLVSTAAILPALIYIGLRVLWDKWRYGRILPSVGEIFWGVVIIEAIVLGYLGYWTLQVVRKNNIDSFKEK